MSTSYYIYRFAKPSKKELSLIDYYSDYDLFPVYDVENEETKESIKLFRNTDKTVDNIKITDVCIDIEGSKKINKKPGNYITIEFDDITDYNNKEKVKNIFVQELKKIIKNNKINGDDSCLIVGLGNSNSTPDSLGPKTVENIIVRNNPFV